MAEALLAAFPLPPQRVAEAAQLAEGSALAFPAEGDLTLAGDIGDMLVALTLRPGGRARTKSSNEQYFLPTGGEEEAGRINATINIDDGSSTRLDRCGTACSTTTLEPCRR